jgi:hypothetical protein
VPKASTPQRPSKSTFTTRQAERRAALVSQPWPDFLRDLAVRFAVVLAVIVVLTVVFWLIRG